MTGNPKIGGEEFDAGSTPIVIAAVQTLEVIQRDGIDGHEFRERGKRAPAVRWRTERGTSSPATRIAAYATLSGTLQTITNVDGSTIVAAVQLAGEPSVKRLAKACGGVEGATGIWWVVADWIIQAGT
jgi:hypothetical protein